VLDVQISVASFDQLEAFESPLESIGLVYRAGTSRAPRDSGTLASIRPIRDSRGERSLCFTPDVAEN
jgi:hypothetical protein